MNARECPACGKTFAARERGQRGCSRRCGAVARGPRKMSPAKHEARFYARVSPEPTSGCWLWTGPYDRQGYGHSNVLAHRRSWVLHRGPIPKGADVCHKCDNRACVNPNHLFIGTRLDNMRDCVSKGRDARGEKNGAAKLTADRVQEIRDALARGATQRAIAAQFGVAQATIWKIASRKGWNR